MPSQRLLVTPVRVVYSHFMSDNTVITQPGLGCLGRRRMKAGRLGKVKQVAGSIPMGPVWGDWLLQRVGGVSPSLCPASLTWNILIASKGQGGCPWTSASPMNVPQEQNSVMPLLHRAQGSPPGHRPRWEQEPPAVSGDLESAAQEGKEKLFSGAGKKRGKAQRVKQPSILEAIFATVSLGFISLTISHLLLNQSCWGNGVKLREIRGRNGSAVYINICLYYIEYCS